MMVAIFLVACKGPQLEQRIELLQVVRTANSEMRGGCLLSPPCRKRPNVRFASLMAVTVYHSYCNGGYNFCSSAAHFHFWIFLRRASIVDAHTALVQVWN